MIQDVLLPFLSWYLLISLLGAVALPLAQRWLSALPDKGYAFARPLGLLLWTFIFWLLSSLGVLSNNAGGNLFALLLLAGLSGWALRAAGWGTLRDWLREKRGMILTMEALFFVLFLALTLFRSIYPDLTATEKPMELAFLNAILRSPQMPPFDPWLSGYAISYYYMGYVMTALLTRLSGVAAGVGFNLMIALVFSLGGLGAYGLTINLLTVNDNGRKLRNRFGALFAPLFVVLMGNAAGFLEYIHLRGWFWGLEETFVDAEGITHSRFWDWLNIRDLVSMPNLAAEQPQLRFWWWWRGSRVIRDLSYSGGDVELIDEFPFFSLLLADLHPHVLVIPFAFLAAAIALNLFLRGGQPRTDGGWLQRPMFNFALSREYFLVGALVFGALAFLNIWDFPLYVGLFVGAYVLHKAAKHGWSWGLLGEFLTLGISFGVAGVLLYLPYYVGFASQAGGILPNVIHPSRGAQIWVMFGVLWLPIFGYVLYALRKHFEMRKLGIGVLVAAGGGLLLLGFSRLLVWSIASLSPSLAGISPQLANAASEFVASSGAASLQDLLGLGAQRRLAAWPTMLTLLLLVGVPLGLSLTRENSKDRGTHSNDASPFAWLLILFGALLVIVPEFIYLRDVFGTRMNTVFKFWYQAWLLWGVAAAYGSVVVLSQARGVGRWAFALLLYTAVGLGAFYPSMAINEKIEDYLERPDTKLSLDGTAHFNYLGPEEHAAVDYLAEAPLGVLVEAVGGSFTGYARISAHSGQIGLLGWPGHESQWRGGGEEMGSRAADIQRIYESTQWDETRELLARYDVQYIIVAPLEMNTYVVSLAKFEQHLDKVFEQGAVSIYVVPPLTTTVAESP